MESCRDMEVYLSLKLDGMLEPEEERALEAHLAVCPRCRALERELSAVHTALPELEEYEAPEGFARGVMERVAELEKKPKVVPLFRRPQVRALMGLAACAVLCVGLYQSGLFRKDAIVLSQASYDGEDFAAYQEEGAASGTKRAEEPLQAEGSAQAGGASLDDGSLQTEEPVQADGGAQAQDATPEETMAGAEPGTREAPGTDGAEGQEQDAVPADAAQEQPAVQPSQFQTTAQAPQSAPAVAGQAVAAVLTLDRLPQGWEDVLGESPEWLTDEEERTCCIITAGQLQQLQELAGREGMNASLEGGAAEDQPCALVVLEGIQ